MKEKLIIFDYDGVIADSLDMILGVFDDICDEINHKTYLKKKDIMEINNLISEELVKCIRVPKEKRNFFLKRINELLKERSKNVNLFGNIAGTIKSLCKNSYLAIISANNEKAIKSLLMYNHLEEFFDCILGSGSKGEKSKKIEFLVGKYSIKKENTFFIGDTVSDILAAKKASVKSIAVTWGFQKIERLKKEKPDFIVENSNELIGIIN